MSTKLGDFWGALPDAAKVQTIFLGLEKLISGPEPQTPYQFTLGAIGELYKTLQPDGATTSFPGYVYEKAKAASLRAIAYFSWERAAQVFLTRRVFPTYFDFLSYSHVPGGWGALGVMLKELEEEGRRYQKQAFTVVRDIRRNRILFPYLREATRLDYSAVLVLPVFNDAKTDQSTLLGACCFYLKNGAALPESAAARERLRCFAEAMADAVARHEDWINDAELSRNWNEGLSFPESHPAELIISIHPDGNPDVLNQIAATLVRSLSGPDLYAISDPAQEAADPKRRVIMIAARHGIDRETIRKHVLNAAGHACVIADGDHYVSYRLKDL